MRKLIRRYLRLDTWGWDIFRLKRRVSAHEQRLNTLDHRLYETCEAGLSHVRSSQKMLDRIEEAERRLDTHAEAIERIVHMVDPELAADIDAELEAEVA